MSRSSRARRPKSRVTAFTKSLLYLANAVQNREIRQAYDTIKSKAKKFVDNVDLVSPDDFTLDGEESEMVIMCMSFGNEDMVETF